MKTRSLVVMVGRLLPVAALAAMWACSSDVQGEGATATAENASSIGDNVRLPRYVLGVQRPDGSRVGRPRRVQAPVTNAPNEMLQYSGGRVLANVQVQEVNWTAGVNSTWKSGMEDAPL